MRDYHQHQSLQDPGVWTRPAHLIALTDSGTTPYQHPREAGDVHFPEGYAEPWRSGMLFSTPAIFVSEGEGIDRNSRICTQDGFFGGKEPHLQAGGTN